MSRYRLRAPPRTRHAHLHGLLECNCSCRSRLPLRLSPPAAVSTNFGANCRCTICQTLGQAATASPHRTNTFSRIHLHNPTPTHATRSRYHFVTDSPAVVAFETLLASCTCMNAKLPRVPLHMVPCTLAVDESSSQWMEACAITSLDVVVLSPSAWPSLL
jgi:hypothetical protein